MTGDGDWEFSTGAGCLQNLPFGHRFVGEQCRCGTTLGDVQDCQDRIICELSPQAPQLVRAFREAGLDPDVDGMIWFRATMVAQKEYARRLTGIPRSEWDWPADDGIAA